MRIILFILSLSLVIFFGCDNKHSSATQQSAPSGDGALAVASSVETPVDCDSAPLLSCQEALDLYVATYRFIPKEPHGKVVLWSLYISGLAETANKIDIGPKEMGEFIFGAHRVPLLIEQCEDGTIDSESAEVCPTLLKDKTQFLDTAKKTRENMPILVEGFFLDTYVKWADEGRLKMARNETTTIRDERHFYWFPWVRDQRFILDEEKFMAFAKSKSFCDSDESYSYIDLGRQKSQDSGNNETKEEKEEGFTMHPELKRRICAGESLALSEREMLSINFPMKFKEVRSEE